MMLGLTDRAPFSIFQGQTTKLTQLSAYVLMTTHVHLLITPSENDSGSLLMKHLGQAANESVERMELQW